MKNAISTAETHDIVDQSTAEPCSVVLRGISVPLNSDVAELFIADCARNIEGLLSDLEIRTKYELTTEQMGTAGREYTTAAQSSRGA